MRNLKWRQMEGVAKNIPQAVVIQGYGLTETCGIVAVENAYEGGRHSGATGILVPGVEAKIVSVDKLNAIPPVEHGELWVRGPNMMLGYLHNPEATKLTIDKQGWVHTGDLGYFDERGQLFVVDRIKELIKYKGFQQGIGINEILDAIVKKAPPPPNTADNPLRGLIFDRISYVGLFWF